MANNIAFQPMGKTVKVVATGSANTESNVFTITATSPVNQYMLSNDSVNSFAYVWISSTNAFNVALPESNVTGTYVVAVPPYAYMTITGPQVSQSSNVYAKVIGDAANSAVYVTPGEGLL
jgi:hypothetical protein